MKKQIALLLLFVLLLGLGGCGEPAAPAGGQPQGSGPAPFRSEPASPDPDHAALPDTDPSGAAITIPERVESVVVLAPSLAQTVVDLGMGEKIVGYDLQSVGLDGLPQGVPTFDTVAPDVEKLVALAPDMLLVSSLSLYDQEAPYQPLMDAGVCVICVPTSESIEDVKADIRFLAAALRVPAAGEALVEELETQLDELAAVVARIPQAERKKVYFEISPAPYMYSTGGGTYLHEMIQWVGGENILAGQEGWLSVEGESVVAADPDVIFTNVNYTEDPVGEVLSRGGWAGVSAVKNGAVYAIDNLSSSLPNENIIAAMREMAAALYPDLFPAG